MALGASQDAVAGQVRLSPELRFDSREHPSVVVSELGVLSRGMILDEARIVLLDGSTFLFIDPWTDELWVAGGEGNGPGEFAGSGLELGWFRSRDGLTVWDLNNDFRLTDFSDKGRTAEHTTCRPFTRRLRALDGCCRSWGGVR